MRRSSNAIKEHPGPPDQSGGLPKPAGSGRYIRIINDLHSLGVA